MHDPRTVVPRDIGEHGLACACDCGCEKPLHVGDVVTELPEGMYRDAFIVVVVCWDCRDHENTL